MKTVNLLAPDFHDHVYSLYAELRNGPVRQVEPAGLWATAEEKRTLAEHERLVGSGARTGDGGRL